MPTAPELFRVGVTGARLDWPSAGGERNVVDDHLAAGIEIEAVVTRWLGFRLGVTFGGTEIRSPSAEGTDVRHVLVEVMAAPRLAIDRLRDEGVTPWAEVGLGTLVHDPDDDALVSRNQNALVFGAGVDWDALGPLGVRAGWRRTRLELADVFDPEDRGSTEVWTSRVVVGAYWRL